MNANKEQASAWKLERTERKQESKRTFEHFPVQTSEVRLNIATDLSCIFERHRRARALLSVMVLELLGVAAHMWRRC